MAAAAAMPSIPKELTDQFVPGTDSRPSKRFGGRVPIPGFVVFALWLTVAALGSTWQVTGFVDAERSRRRVEFDRVYAVLAQRLDQTEAVIDGLVALLRSSSDKTFPALRAYSDEMLRRYPHLYTIGYQPRVDAHEREAFERLMGLRLARPFRIRDFDYAGARRWRDSPPRPFYYPVTFMAPELTDAQDVIGFDLTEDVRFRAAVERSARLDRAVATLPFDLAEGGRGYIMVRALQALKVDGTSVAGADAGRPAHLLSPLIRADRLLLGIELPRAAALALHNPEAREAAALIWQVAAVPKAMPAARWLPALPELRFRRVLPSAVQPFEFELVAHAHWSDFAWRAWALWLSAWTLLVIGGVAAATVLSRARAERGRARQQRVLAERQLAEAEQRAESSRAQHLDELGAGIAHELGQPLAAVIAYSQAALRMMAEPLKPAALDELRRTLQSNAEQALRAGDLMQRIRALVRRQPVAMREMVMQDAILAALALEQARIDATAVTVARRLPAAPVEIVGDRMLIEQLLSNLLRNAIESLGGIDDRSRRVTIGLDAGARHCRVMIEDNGPGMSEAQRARAFHPFRSSKPGGIGVGLVVCATIARAHGGEIAIEPVGDAAPGVRLVVTLPLQEQE